MATRASGLRCSSNSSLLEDLEDLEGLEDLGPLQDRVVSRLQFHPNLEAGVFVVILQKNIFFHALLLQVCQ